MVGGLLSTGVGFAVVDLETTGLYTRTDRVLEIGVVLLDAAGTVEAEWCTLVNPGRDVGPVELHGISARDVLAAPTFEQVAGDLVGMLTRRVFVAHNSRFDLSFLVAEYGRLGIELPIVDDDCICTMKAARTFLPAASRNLAACCSAAGVVQSGQHEALADAQAAAALLGYYLAQASEAEYWTYALRAAAMIQWPMVTALGASPLRRADAQRRDRSHFVARLVERMPRVPVPNLDEYFALLDRVLLDRYLAETEIESLVALALELDLDRESALIAHREYLGGLAALAKQDGVVTDEERSDLVAVAGLLGLADDAVDTALAETRSPQDDGSVVGSFAMTPGDHVVFTGSMVQPRDWWEAQAALAGLAAKPSVTKKTRLVVAADPDSQSGKAARARVYGIPVVTEEAFGRMLGLA